MFFQQRIANIDPERPWPGGKIDLVAPRGKIFPCETEAIGEVEYFRGRDVNASDIIGKCLLQSAAAVERVVFLEAGTLADHAVGAAAAGAKKAEAHAVIDTRATFNPIEAGKPIVAEQFGVVELEILAVLVGYFARIAAVGA